MARQTGASTQASGGARWWVVGGVYTGTDFAEVAGETEERIGPFATYEEAFDEWSRRAWRSVDDANARYRIERQEEPR